MIKEWNGFGLRCRFESCAQSGVAMCSYFSCGRNFCRKHRDNKNLCIYHAKELNVKGWKPLERDEPSP